MVATWVYASGVDVHRLVRNQGFTEPADSSEPSKSPTFTPPSNIHKNIPWKFQVRAMMAWLTYILNPILIRNNSLKLWVCLNAEGVRLKDWQQYTSSECTLRPTTLCTTLFLGFPLSFENLHTRGAILSMRVTLFAS